MGRLAPDHRIDGRWTSCVDRNGEQCKTLMGSVYYSMRQRCIPAQRVGNARLRYAGVKLHRDWATFQAFAEWCSSQPGWKFKYHLDKDLLFPGNKVYGPKTCCLLPRQINSAIIVPQHKLRLLGARKINNRWAAVRGKKYIGTFDTELEAHQVYCLSKEANVRRLAEECKATISKEAYEALMKWTVAAYS